MRPDYQTPERMALKLAAVQFPDDLIGKSVLDIGCEAGAWCGLSVRRGARRVLGVDRGRFVKSLNRHVDFSVENKPESDACRFLAYEVGTQWPELGKHDLVLLMSLYHHIYNLCADHNAIWFYLWTCMEESGLLIWENPVDATDVVVKKDVSRDLHSGYTLGSIMSAASQWFDVKPIGRALHSPTRVVWHCRPKNRPPILIKATVRKGAGGARKAFLYHGGYRINELNHALGYRPFPGSLNLEAEYPMPFDRYVRFQMHDVVDRSAGLDSQWSAFWMRAYPMNLVRDGNAVAVHALRFERDEVRYRQTFVELISSANLRELMGLADGDQVTLESPR